MPLNPYESPKVAPGGKLQIRVSNRQRPPDVCTICGAPATTHKYKIFLAHPAEIFFMRYNQDEIQESGLRLPLCTPHSKEPGVVFAIVTTLALFFIFIVTTIVGVGLKGAPAKAGAIGVGATLMVGIIVLMIVHSRAGYYGLSGRRVSRTTFELTGVSREYLAACEAIKRSELNQAGQLLDGL